MSPQEIRAIRGPLSRAAFARLLEVTPLTVLRWELPEESKEARRPRPRMVEALRKLAADGLPAATALADPTSQVEEDDGASLEPALGSRQRPSAPPPPVSPSPSGSASPAPPAFGLDVGEVMATLDRLHREGWRNAEDEMLALLSSGQLTSASATTLARLGLAQAQMLRLDARAALTTVLPLLAEVERGDLPPPVQGRVHLMGALVFGAPDARTFDAGRVNAHATRADELLEPNAVDARVLVAVARMAASRFLGPAVIARTYATYKATLDGAVAPLARFMAEELHARAARMAGDAEAAARHEDASLVLAERLGVEPILLALLADRAWRRLRSARKAEAVLELTGRIRERARAAGLVACEPLVRGLACECEVLIRLGRLGDAESTLADAMTAAKQGGVPRYALVAPAAHLYQHRGRPADLEALAGTLDDDTRGFVRGAPDLHSTYLHGVAALLGGDVARAADLADRICSAPETAPEIDYLLHDAFVELAICVTLLRDPARVRATVQRFEACLADRPSMWHTALLRRIEGLGAFLDGRLAEARQKFEASLAIAILVGDVVQVAFGHTSLALAARAAGDPDADARFAKATATLESYGVVPRGAILAALVQAATPPSGGTSSGGTASSVAERLVVAAERLSVHGMPDDLARRELVATLAALFPASEIVVGEEGIADPADELTELVDGAGARARVVVRGALDPEQRAALRMLAMFTAAASGGMRPPASAVDVGEVVLPSFIAVSAASRNLVREISQLSRSTAPVLVLGESGSGKEVVARALHDLSLRAKKPYVPFNCASVSRDLFDGQLFGYRKGAFTGAISDSPGVIRAADGGTLFLDEIGELPLDTQPKLLRFLENGEVFPLGEQKPRRVDVRVLAATHRDLHRLVREGLFREDLYYRLNVVSLAVPPLRERKEDVIALARAFVARLSPGEVPELGADALAALQAHSWPGNVRELRNVIERAMAYAPVPSVLRAGHLRLG